MRQDARYGTAITLLDEILQGEPAEKVLTNWARANRYAGSGDRAAVRDIVFSALRGRNSFAATGGSMNGRGIILGMVCAAGDDPDTIFTGERHAPAVLTDGERDVVSSGKRADVYDVPEWLLPQLQADLGPSFAEVMENLRSRAPVDLRVNRIKATVEQAVRSLARDGIEVEPLALNPNGLRVTEGERKLARSAAYLGGLVELQDAGAQKISTMLAALVPSTVLDYCAGGGGKTLAIASEVDSRAKFTAFDKSLKRLQNITERATRAGVDVALAHRDPVLNDETFDLVVLDVPCSGSGAWRRNPDSKWKFARSDLDDLLRTQADILDTTSKLVSPDGWLCYITCSILSAENTAQIDRFREINPDWMVVDQRRFLPSVDSDGFFVSILRRESNF